jgi:hypothetical protein
MPYGLLIDDDRPRHPSRKVHSTMLEAILFAAIGLLLLGGLGATARTGSLDRIDPSLWRHAHH